MLTAISTKLKTILVHVYLPSILKKLTVVVQLKQNLQGICELHLYQQTN